MFEATNPAVEKLKYQQTLSKALHDQIETKTEQAEKQKLKQALEDQLAREAFEKE